MQMYTPTRPVAPRVLVLLHLSLPTMRATQLRSSMAMSGRDALLRFVRTASLAVAPVSVVVAASAAALEVAVASLAVAVVALLVVAALPVDSVAVVVSLVLLLVVVLAAVALKLPLPRIPRTHSLILQPLAASEARSSMFAMCVLPGTSVCASGG